jgi:hypothetical protein
MKPNSNLRWQGFLKDKIDGGNRSFQTLYQYVVLTHTIYLNCLQLIMHTACQTTQQTNKTTILEQAHQGKAAHKRFNFHTPAHN